MRTHEFDMARRRSTVFTDGELRIMRVLWERGPATVAEVVDAIVGPRKPAYNTVLTMLGILEEKGYVRHEKAGRAFAYVPLVDRAEARQTASRRCCSASSTIRRSCSWRT
jgi:BlaI family transcriptional regulator, penicillinase repressor